MKKYFFTMAVMVVFALGFSASDEDTEGTSSPSIEQNVNEQKNPENKSNEKIKEVKEQAQFYGKFWGNSSREMREYKPLDDVIKDYYIQAFEAPQSDEDLKMYKLFKEEFLKTYKAILDAKSKM